VERARSVVPAFAAPTHAPNLVATIMKIKPSFSRNDAIHPYRFQQYSSRHSLS
jgi:hypothetical protein